MLSISRSLKLKLGLVLLAALLLGLGGAYWYFAVYIKTPGYALNKLQSAVAAHDEKTALRYIDLEKFVDKTTDDVSAGLLDDGRAVKGEARAALLDFVKMFRQPLRQSVKGLVLRRLRTGEFAGDDQADNIAIDAKLLLSRTGIAAAQWRGLKEASLHDGDKGKYALCPLIICPAETGEEFALQLRLEPSAEGIYRLTGIDNLAEFFAVVAKKRRELFASYLNQADTLNDRHNKTIDEISQRMELAITLGNLGRDSTRRELKTICDNELIADWQVRQAALKALNVPGEAATLHRLYLKVCEANISYAMGYSAWLEDKNAGTLGIALQKQKEARALAADAAKIRQQIENNEGI